MTEQPGPVVTVYPDGRVVIGAGSTVGEVLQALETARRAVLGVVLNPTPEPPQD